MGKQSTLSEARAAKEKLAKIVRGERAVNGIGIAKIGRGYGVKLNLSGKTSTVKALPPAIDGVPVKVEHVGRISKRTRAKA
jgi:hypothetical protein